MRTLYKSRTNRKIDGVCGGLAAYLGVDVSIVRIVWAIAVLWGTAGFWLYLVCMFIIPLEPDTR